MISIHIRVFPKSGQQKIAFEKDFWRIRLKSLPEKGKANKELVRMLAKYFKVPQSSIIMTKGSSTRNKTVKILGIRPDELEEKMKTAGS